MSESIEPATELLASPEVVKEDTERTSDSCSSKPSSSKLDELFQDRYTMESKTYAKICEGFEQVVCVHPYHCRAKRNFENRGGASRGDWGRGRRDWQGGRGGHWRSDNRQWRGDNRQKRPWSNNSDRGGGDDKKPRHD